MKSLIFKNPSKMISAMEGHAKKHRFKKFIIADDPIKFIIGSSDIRKRILFSIWLGDITNVKNLFLGMD